MYHQNHACGKSIPAAQIPVQLPRRHPGLHIGRHGDYHEDISPYVYAYLCTAPCLCRRPPEAFRSLSRKQTSALSLSTISAASYSQTRQQHITLFSSHNAVRWRLSHEGARFLMRQRQWHTAASLMPVQDSCTVLYLRSGIRTNQSSHRTKTGTTFLHMANNAKPYG